MPLDRRIIKCFISNGLIGLILIYSSQCFSENVRDEHGGFSNLLSAHVKNGVVDYRSFSSNPRFDAYLDYIAQKQFTEENSEAEKIAFYLNAYNALAIKGIVDGSSPSSFFSKITYFYRDKYTIAEETMNLYDLEHEIIRPFKEPRIHFALVCASRSCPKLRNEAYTADKLDNQLSESAVDFINDESKNDFDVGKKVARISKIFSWFKEDFSEQKPLSEFIAQYVDDEAIKAALNQNDLKIKYMKYDWSLNGTL